MPKIFHLILIKPSRYDVDGYPIRWSLPFNSSSSLSCLYGLAQDCSERKILGPDVTIVLHAFDEIYEIIDIEALLETAKSGDGAFVGFVGVQSNQFPRAVDLARPFCEAGVPVCVGGFHVSGFMSMFDELPDDILKAQEMGMSLFGGELEEGRFDQVLIDAWNGKRKQVYNYLNDMPCVENQPVPVLPASQVPRFLSDPHENWATFDLSRGCPYKCSFCSVINVHGRKSRYRSADDFEKMLRAFREAGINRIFITDDNFVRNKNWNNLLDRLIEMRENENLKFDLIIQVDMLSHKNPVFIEKAIKAGVIQLFIGMENINPDNLASVGKVQNNIDDYREMLLAWKKYPVIIMAGYIVGMAADTKASILRDVETIKRELPIDLLLLSYLTPLPGSVDHVNQVKKGDWMDPDMNKYDLTHRVSHHANMTDKEWDEAYNEAWDLYYTPEHMETVLKRAAALGSDLKLTTATLLLLAKFNHQYFGMHTFEGGISRIRVRDERRPGMPKEPMARFYTKGLKENLLAKIGLAYHYSKLTRLAKRIWKDPRRFDYVDEAIGGKKQCLTSAIEASKTEKHFPYHPKPTATRL